MVNFEKKCISVSVDGEHGWMAERSKAPVEGTGLYGGMGSKPTPIIFFFFGGPLKPNFEQKRITVGLTLEYGWMAERSKAPV